jgi:pimeloyl-ACP methyl ester carboxylesterase
MADIIFVAGSWHGGWYYASVVQQLRDTGHRVCAVTLSGVAERRHQCRHGVNLQTHIDDVLVAIEMEGMENPILVAHSYGGMVITGVASQAIGKIRALVYLDAVVPQDGQSQWQLLPQPVQDYFLSACSDGLTLDPPEELDRRTSPHPFATFLQKLSVPKDTFDVEYKSFVWAELNPDGVFKQFHDRLIETPGWHVSRIPCGHDLMNEAPDAVLNATLEAIRSTEGISE